MVTGVFVKSEEGEGGEGAIERGKYKCEDGGGSNVKIKTGGRLEMRRYRWRGSGGWKETLL